jgi:L-threonylcarbamoyladenylate synthase
LKDTVELQFEPVTQVSQSDLIAGAKVGKVVSFPTDTVPALAVKPDNAPLIFDLKQRATTKPLILMGAKFSDLLPYVQGSPTELQVWQEMAQTYFPGALTLVLPASPAVPPGMNPTNSGTIGVRVPDSEIAREILTQTFPLATTSANLSGQPPLETMTAIERAFSSVLTLAWEKADVAVGSGLPSTVAKWTGAGWEILRQGSVTVNT